MALWDKIGSRGNIEDRRDMRSAGGLGITGIAIYLIVSLLSGGEINMGDVLSRIDYNQIARQQTNTQEFEGVDEYEAFAGAVLGSADDAWRVFFTENNIPYTPPRLVLFRNTTSSGCGYASSATGPHYCPLDKTIYLDETFFEELTRELGAQGGDVAEAYVIAHEVGHHIQNELGIMDEVHSAPEKQQQDLSIKLELQADCFAGLWAYSIKDKGIFENGEINEAIDAAAAVGDDRIQEQVTGRINPESWTHGSSIARVSWFNKGYISGVFSQCDTFK